MIFLIQAEVTFLNIVQLAPSIMRGRNPFIFSYNVAAFFKKISNVPTKELHKIIYRVCNYFTFLDGEGREISHQKIKQQVYSKLLTLPMSYVG